MKNQKQTKFHFSILIPSWNNLPFLKLCVESIRKNSTVEHQIIIHVNEGSDGTLKWVRDMGFDYTYTENNVGVCLAMNMMRTKVATDFIYFLNDDMYVLPGWDLVLMEEIKKMHDNRFFLSSTTIQPSGGTSMIGADFGRTVEAFKESLLLENYSSLLGPGDWMGATIPPNIVHRDIWDLVGGYSVEYSPGMYSDPDFTAKLWLCGVRYLKGLDSSRVYHFESKSTERIQKNCGQMQFLMKWGVTSSTFRRFYTLKGKQFSPELVNCHLDYKKIRWHRIRSRLKAVVYIITGRFGPLWRF